MDYRENNRFASGILPAHSVTQVSPVPDPMALLQNLLQRISFSRKPFTIHDCFRKTGTIETQWTRGTRNKYTLIPLREPAYPHSPDCFFLPLSPFPSPLCPYSCPFRPSPLSLLPLCPSLFSFRSLPLQVRPIVFCIFFAMGKYICLPNHCHHETPEIHEKWGKT